MRALALGGPLRGFGFRSAARMKEQPTLAGLDLLATAVVVLDESLTVQWINVAAETLLGMSRRAMKRRRFADVFGGTAALEEQLRTAISEQRGFWDQWVALARPGGEVLHVNCVATPIESSGG